LQTSALTYKLIKKIRDERFDEELIHQTPSVANRSVAQADIGGRGKREHAHVA